MHLTRLRIAGFKTFVEPTEVPIERGLTGIVGPNGCGKSNLVEALRWVMGETSHKAMRGSGMDDVIFSGNTRRPARSHAEVMLTADNSARTAPAAFNAEDILEISRRIEREAGSSYRINGREARARDVQILFADAATGARSAALVRQGQINEIISAKPQARRRILEDAAGIAGLHTRRDEAELRLKGAEDNLVRVEDVIREIEGQLESLKKQSRQAGRYRALSTDIRKVEALILLIGCKEALKEVEEAKRKASQAAQDVAEATLQQAQTAKVQAIAAHALPALRQREVEAAARLQRLTLARHELDAEEKRAKEKLAGLERRIEEIRRDIARFESQNRDAGETLEKLAQEREAVFKAQQSAQEKLLILSKESEAASHKLAQAEETFAKAQSEAAEAKARRAALERLFETEKARLRKAEEERFQLKKELAAFEVRYGSAPDFEVLKQNLSEAQNRLETAEQQAQTLRKELAQAREAESAARSPAEHAERQAQKLETEARTLARLFAVPQAGKSASLLDQIRVSKGFETAFGAALGEDLEASLEETAPRRWIKVEADDAPLPEGVEPLIAHVEAPQALQRLLRQIGFVEDTQGPILQHHLKAGQILVSRTGALWRWDGFAAKADAPSSAARRLAEKNRLGELEMQAAKARETAQEARLLLENAAAQVKRLAKGEAAALEETNRLRKALELAAQTLAKAEREDSERAARKAALDATAQRLDAELIQVQAQCEAAAQALHSAPATSEAPLEDARLLQVQARTQMLETSRALQKEEQEIESCKSRLARLEKEEQGWKERLSSSEATRLDLHKRLEEAQGEHARLLEAPDETLLKRRALQQEIETAEAARKAAADDLAEAETRQREIDAQAKKALENLLSTREERATLEARLEASQARLAALENAAQERFDTSSNGLKRICDWGEEPLPNLEETEARLLQLKNDRERLGAVNLRAEEELVESETKHTQLCSERDDLIEAIKRLRSAVHSLNREGRERLLKAFEAVNAHFQTLFTHLFGGGTAELTLIDADDPLEAGLDILARPPGKKPQTMTLLSGGEQALTAIALIFAVFLTNPSPICVLDEVDAPLDDANVERYCDLLQDMASKTQTRFLVVTHNPLTMARMDRLLGVTMAEKGVSQLVSVDLGQAERMLKIG